MPDLIAKSPLSGQPVLVLGAATLSEVLPGPITSVSPLKGQEKPLAKALKSLGLTFPAPNRFVTSGPARLVWTSRDQAFLIGADPIPLQGCAALSDQSDGWAALRLEGEGAEDVLARLLPLDLRLAAFAVGHSARAPFNHMPSIVMRTGPASFDIYVFRSMARTAWHEAQEAMTAVAARRALTPAI